MEITEVLSDKEVVITDDTVKIMRFEAKKQGDRIVLTNIEDERRKWLFVKIEDDNFHWQDVRVQDDGKWHVDFDLYARRIY